MGSLAFSQRFSNLILSACRGVTCGQSGRWSKRMVHTLVLPLTYIVHVYFYLIPVILYLISITLVLIMQEFILRSQTPYF